MNKTSIIVDHDEDEEYDDSESDSSENEYEEEYDTEDDKEILIQNVIDDKVRIINKELIENHEYSEDIIELISIRQDLVKRIDELYNPTHMDIDMEEEEIEDEYNSLISQLYEIDNEINYYFEFDGDIDYQISQ